MRIVFFGSPIEVTPVVKALFGGVKLKNGTSTELLAVVTQPDKKVKRGKVLCPTPVAEFAQELGLKTFKPKSTKDDEFLEALTSLNADVFVTAAYGKILSRRLLDIPRRATINIHPSNLPLYRGATPIQSALKDGLTETTITILFTEFEMDAGSLISQKHFLIHNDETAGELTSRLFEESCSMLSDSLSKLLESTFQGTQQDSERVTHCKKISKEDGQIDWNQASTHIVNSYRAFSPWPGSYSFLKEKPDERILLYGLQVFQGVEMSSLNSGLATWDSEAECFIVQTGEGLVTVKELARAGKKRVTAKDFLNSLGGRKEFYFGA